MKNSLNRVLERFTEALSLAFILEASGYPKPGNVHRLLDRRALRYEAFLATGVLAYKYMRKGLRRGLRGEFREVVLGDLVYGLVRDVVVSLKSSNTCLGSSLLLSLMSVSIGQSLRYGLSDLASLSFFAREVLRKTTVSDTIYYYRAIRKASPSYLKKTDYTGEYVNVWDPTYKKKLLERNHKLVDVLEYSSKFDVVADEALSGFKRGLEAEEFLRKRFKEHFDLNRAIVETYLYLLSKYVDTVVYLKHGSSVASSIMENAERVLDLVISRKNNEWMIHVKKFDDELQSRNINPGAIADLTAEAIALYMIRNIVEENRLLDLSH
ncbi:MAG: triphosphoribosyl-dephospho-CoA synthase [Desulfurococcaceae archaeon]